MAGRITVESAELEAPMAPLPYRLLLDKELSAGALKTYVGLVWCVWERERRGLPGYEGQRKFAEMFGMSPRSVTRYLNELRDRGYIETRSGDDITAADEIIILSLRPREEGGEDKWPDG